MRHAVLSPLLLPALWLSCSDYKLNGGAGGNTGGDGGAPGGGDGGAATGDDTGWRPTDDEPGGDGGASDGGTPVEARKIDVVVLVDTAYWYDCYHPEIDVRVAELAEALMATGHDVGFAVATFDDYNQPGEWWAADGGRPYTLVQQLTTDLTAIRSSTASLEMVWGGDGPGTGYEALVQAVRGRGYDQTCDGAYDSSRDVKPWQAAGDDAFGGAIHGVQDTTVAGTGTLAGVGFRTGAARVVVLAVENALRDTAYGHDLPSGACLGAATALDAENALTSAGAAFVGINAYEFQDIDGTPQDQLRSLAANTSALWDEDGDGLKDDLAVLSGSWDWPPVDQAVDVILQVAGVE